MAIPFRYEGEVDVVKNRGGVSILDGGHWALGVLFRGVAWLVGSISDEVIGHFLELGKHF